MGYYLAVKKEENFTLCDSMNGPREIMLSEIRQKKTNIMWFYIYVESNEQTELTSKIETDS